MPRVRKGPDGPKKGAGGKPGDNKKAKPPKGSSGSGNAHKKQLKT